jgi:hypothetical protein
MTQLGHMMLEGRRDSDGEPSLIPLGGVLDFQRLFQGPIAKEQLEDLQIWSVLQVLASSEGTLHPLSVRPIVPDPPDRMITYGNREWRTELTELTIKDIRGDLARVRLIGRQLQERLRERSADFGHLDGWTVFLAKLDGHELPRCTGELLSEFMELLVEDKGFVGQDVGYGPDMGRGIYGPSGPFAITVNQTGQPDHVLVSATSQAMLFRSEVIEALENCVAEKDVPENEIVIISCGLPDKQGYICPFDHAIFLTLEKAVAEGVDILPNPRKHLRGGLIHLWDTTKMITWHGDGENDFPWGNGGQRIRVGGA